MRFLVITIFFVLSTTAHAQWQMKYSNLDYYFEGVHFFADDDLIVYGHSNNVDGNGFGGAFILRTHDLGETWDTTAYLGWTFRDMDFPTPDTGFAIGLYNNTWWGSFKTTDGGYTWVQTSQNMFGSQNFAYNIDCFDTLICVCGSAGSRLITYDGAKNWSIIDNNPHNVDGPNRSKITNDGIYVELAGGNYDFLTYSTDTLTTYTKIPFGSGSYIGYAKFLGDSIMASGNFNGANFGIYDLSDNSLRTFGFIDFSLWDFESGEDYQIWYSVGKDLTTNKKGIIKSLDGGDTWYKQEIDTMTMPWGNSYLSNLTVFNDTLAVAWNNPDIFITKNGGGPLGQQLQKVTSVQEFSQVQTELYPNPTTGQISLNSSQMIEDIKVFSLDGKLVQNLVINQKSHHLDISRLPNGHYFIQINTAKGTETKKVVKI